MILIIIIFYIILQYLNVHDTIVVLIIIVVVLHCMISNTVSVLYIILCILHHTSMIKQNDMKHY